MSVHLHLIHVHPPFTGRTLQPHICVGVLCLSQDIFRVISVKTARECTNNRIKHTTLVKIDVDE
jgi:hypothetical protein